ncbi:hypothetical protein BH11BAC7_BH11BAC7_35190 [soil metagenome]
MKSITATIVLTGMIFFNSCGPTAEEKMIAEKRKIDSITVVTEQATKIKIETKIAYEDSIQIANGQKEQFEQFLSEAKGDLAAAEDKLVTIKGFQFLRSASTRESQIRNQTIVIDNLEKQMRSLQKSLNIIEKNIEYYKEQKRNYQ